MFKAQLVFPLIGQLVSLVISLFRDLSWKPNRVPNQPRIFMALPASWAVLNHCLLVLVLVLLLVLVIVLVLMLNNCTLSFTFLFPLNNPFGRTPSLLAINSTFSVSTINANPNCQMRDDDPLDEQPFKRMKISTNILLWKPLECFVSVCSWTETWEPLKFETEIPKKKNEKPQQMPYFWFFPRTFFVEE